MEEEVNYSTVVIKNGGPPPKEKEEERTVYAEVKPKEPATPAPPQADGKAAAHSHRWELAMCFGILCLFLVASISVIIFMQVAMNEMKQNFSDVSAENENHEARNMFLERRTKSLNQTLGFILKFKDFPVNDYCSGTIGTRTLHDCKPCKKDWIYFQEKCYLFYNGTPPWKPWDDSQAFCKDTVADLVVIDNLQEQEFISNRTEPYYDKEHGYWLGLSQNNDKNWTWVDGHNDTLQYWIQEELGNTGPCALLIPGRPPTASWDPADSVMENKFICESEALIRSN